MFTESLQDYTSEFRVSICVFSDRDQQTEAIPADSPGYPTQHFHIVPHVMLFKVKYIQ